MRKESCRRPGLVSPIHCRPEITDNMAAEYRGLLLVVGTYILPQPRTTPRTYRFISILGVLTNSYNGTKLKPEIWTNLKNLFCLGKGR